jgi:hypothetical protein
MMHNIWELWYTDEFMKQHREMLQQMKDVPDNVVAPCPRCKHGYLVNEGEQPNHMGEYSWLYACDSCDYQEKQ